MKKSTWSSLISATALFALAATGCSGDAGADTDNNGNSGSAAQGESVTLSVSGPRSHDHSLSMAMQAFATDVEEATNGEVAFEFNWDSSLCPEGGEVQCVGSGQADIGQPSPAWEPASFPLTRVGETGWIEGDIVATTKAINEIAQETPEIDAEYEALGMKLLFLAPMNPLVLATSEPVESLADMDNMSLRVSGTWSDFVAPLGVSPISMPQTEQYESIQRGVIDGVITTLDGAEEGSLYEVAPYYGAIGEHTGSTTLSAFTMNRDVYEGLSDDQRAAVDEAASNLVDRWYPEFQGPIDQEICETFKENDATIAPIGSADEAADWTEEARAVSDEKWIQEASAKIDDPQALVDRFRSLVTEYSQENEAEQKNGVQACL